MTMRRLAAIAAIVACGLGAACSGAKGPTITQLDGRKIAVADMEERVEAIMAKAGIPALSVAILERGDVAYTHTFGVRNTKTGEPADEQTVFGAASFSKTVFGYLVMLLVEDGTIDLDRPLHEYIGTPLPELEPYADLADDERWRTLTARMALSHTTGFPNWRFMMEDGRLLFLYDPGERHNYSGEGIVLLQRAIEHVTGRDLETLARERVFEPLGMTHTSYVYQDAWADKYASPHDRYERPRNVSERREPNAAGSMVTTAGDYAKLLAAIMQADGRRMETMAAMLRTQVFVEHRNMFGPGSREPSDEPGDIQLGWCLGWGRFDCSGIGRAIFHTGHDFGTQNYHVAYVDRGIGVVMLANSDNFEGVARELAVATIGDDCSPFDWIGYPYFDPNDDRTPPPEPVVIDVDPDVLARYVGRYRMNDGREFTIARDGATLTWSGETGNAPLHAIADDTFFIEGEEFRIVFVEENGTIPRFELRLGDDIRIPVERVD